MIEHKVDNDARDGYKHPTGPNVSCPFFVSFKVFFEGTPHNENNKGHIDCRKNDVWDEDTKINGAGPIVVGVRHGSHLDVIDHIGCEKDHGGNQGNDHILFMGLDVALFDLKKTQ